MLRLFNWGEITSSGEFCIGDIHFGIMSSYVEFNTMSMNEITRGKMQKDRGTQARILGALWLEADRRGRAIGED